MREQIRRTQSVASCCRRILVSSAALMLFPAASQADPSPNYIQQENAKPGTSDWNLTNPGVTSGIIEGYASLASVNRGGQIQFFVNTAEPSYSLDIFRMGYYGGLGGRRMLDTISLTGVSQPAPTMDPTTGLIECNWVNPYTLTIPNTPDPTDWMSGIYLVKLTAGTSGTQQYIVFTVRDDARASDMLMAQTVNTYQAYNPWGGKSLYGTIENRSDTANKAMKVSFDRPYYGDDGNGASAFFHWEFPMLQWLEQGGYDVSYTTNVEVDGGDGSLLLSHKVFLSVGHDEYWTWSMRDHVEAARDQGVNLGFFSGNVSYWQVRYEPSVFTGDPDRTLVGYKEFWYEDPIEPDYLKTNEFRYAPVNRPEDAMIGVSYITVASVPMVVEDASNWVFTGTSLHDGDVLTYPDGSPVLGYEVDEMGPESPPTTHRLAHSPATPDGQHFSDMTVYVAPSGATVFAAGSINWPLSLPPIAQMTRNILAQFLTGAFATVEGSPAVRASLPGPFLSQDIGDVGRAGFVSAVGNQSFTINGAGQDIYNDGSDALYFVSQPMSGDGQITARLTELELYWDNRAGVMIRESLSPDAKSASLVARPTGSVGAVNEGVEFVVRSDTGGAKAWLAQADLNQPNWLRLTRQGDTFTSSASADGVNWISIGSTTIPMASTVYIGASVTSARYGTWATATFDNVSVVTGGNPCSSVTLSQTSFDSSASGSDWPVDVTTPDGSCTWNVSSDSPWLVVTSTPASPAGNGSILVHTDTNTGGSRVGHFTIAGATYTVSQDGVSGGNPCSSVTLSQTSFYSGVIESGWPVAVTAPDGTCTWTVTSDSSWLVVTSTPASPAGSGSIWVATDTNTGGFRVGHFTIAGATYTVYQDGATPNSTQGSEIRDPMKP